MGKSIILALYCSLIYSGYCIASTIPNQTDLIRSPNGRITINGDITTPLHHAINQNDIELARRLIRAGASVNAVDNNNVSPLESALVGNNLLMISLLLQQEGINISNRALDLATRYGTGSTIQLLINAGVDVNRRFGDDLSLLEAAVLQDNRSVIASLLAAGANITPLAFTFSLGDSRQMLNVAQTNRENQMNRTTATRRH